MAETKYVILKAESSAVVSTEAAWQEIGRQAAGNPEAAVRAFLNTGDNGDTFGEGTYRGVAERSWGEPIPIQKKISFG